MVELLQKTENYLRPIVCTLCGKYIMCEFDFELHLFADHNIRSESRIKNAVAEGKELGLKVDATLLQQLNENFFSVTPQMQSPRQSISHEWRPASTSQAKVLLR